MERPNEDGQPLAPPALAGRRPQKAAEPADALRVETIDRLVAGPE
ncbi:hypothetical protein ACFYVK_31700 [Streptomyces chartreusis]